MNFEVILTKEFVKSLKALAKRYHSIKEDISTFCKNISDNPFQGNEIAPDIRKIRMAISSKGKGKSAGARIITYTVVTSIKNGRVYLIEIYDKSDTSSIDPKNVVKLLNELFDNNG